MHDNRVDEDGEVDGVDEVRNDLGALRNGPRHNGGRGCGERELEEEEVLPALIIRLLGEHEGARPDEFPRTLR